MPLLQTLITYKATVAVWGLLFTPAIGAAGYYEAHTDRGLFGLAPIPGPTVYLEPSATPTATVTATETETMTAPPSVLTIAQAPGPTVLPSPATTETLIVPLPVPFPTTATETATVTPSSTPTPTPTPTRTGRNHANGLKCFVLVEVDQHGTLIKHPCPKD